jgi:GNAT superfamily N-acetyltransferase
MTGRTRPARLDDLAALAAIERSAAQRFLGTPMAFAAGHPPTPHHVLEASLAQRSLWVATDAADRPQGFLFGSARTGWFHIDEVSVAIGAQGAGLGSALLAAVAEAAPGLGCDRLSLTTDRDIAFNGPWYRRHGFVEIAAADAPDWLAAILAHEASIGLDPVRRAILVRRL